MNLLGVIGLVCCGASLSNTVTQQPGVHFIKINTIFALVKGCPNFCWVGRKPPSKNLPGTKICPKKLQTISSWIPAPLVECFFQMLQYYQYSFRKIFFKKVENIPVQNNSVSINMNVAGLLNHSMKETIWSTEIKFC